MMRADAGFHADQARREHGRTIPLTDIPVAAEY
jgi:hypothetical protein